MYYRIHPRKAWDVLSTEGLRSYAPNETELGRQYSNLYPGNRWWDQQLLGVEYRLYLSDHQRPCTPDRFLLRVPLLLHQFTLRRDSQGYTYISTGSQALILYSPDQVEIAIGERWCPLKELQGVGV